MGKWQKILLNEAAQLHKGQQVNRASLDTTGDYYVLNGGMQPSGYLPIFNTKENTISISEGGNSCGYVQYNIEKFWSGGHNYTLKNINSILQDKFLYFYLKYRESIIMSMRVGSGLPNIQKKDINKFPILFPQNIKEQEKIAEILGELDKVIDTTKKLIDKYTLIKEGMLQDLLTNGIDENGKIRSEATHKYKDSPLGRIPVEYEVKRFKDVIPLQRGYDLPFSKIEKGEFPIAYSNGIYGKHNRYIKKAPCIWTGRSGTIGNVFYSEENCWFHNTSLWVTSFKGNYPKYIYYLFTATNFDKYNSGTGVPTLNRNDLYLEYVSIPLEIDEQIKIANNLDIIERRLEAEKIYLRKLQLQKQALMQDLLTNKVSVDCLL